MNKYIFVGILLPTTIFLGIFSLLYEINIQPRNISADQNQDIDTCSPQFYLDNMWKGTNSVRVQNACLEQINLKLDKLISLEQQERTP